MAKDKFMFFQNFKAIADKLDDDMRLKFYDALTNYVFNDEEPTDVIISALVEAIKPSLDKVDGRQNNGGNHNPNGVNQHSKVGQSGQFWSKLVNSGQILSETETETETEIKEKEISKDIPKKKITVDSELAIKTYGENKKVRLTDEQYAKLQELYGRRLENAIQILDGYLAESTKNEKKYTNHYAVMRRNNWVYNKTFDGDFVPLKPQIADMSNFVRAKPLGDEE